MQRRVKAFYGTSNSAAKSQIRIAVAVYVLVADVGKRLNLSRSLYEALPVISLERFEEVPLDAALARIPTPSESQQRDYQLVLH